MKPVSVENQNGNITNALLGVVKEKRTSLYYGVRVDKRIKNQTETIWYRASIEAENKKYYLGAYINEQHAAYAFNIGFAFLENGKYKIENYVEIGNNDKNIIFNKVRKLMLKRGLIHYL